ncbi:MAG: DUF4126 domain-containing protein [Magnetococcales bacterium]|nr:DUF4126 domain-containing protein [Magnetococcales bacterium]
MEAYQELITAIALAMGVGWASGINLYATMLTLGFMSMTDNMVLPPDLEVLGNPLVIGAAGLMYAVEFFADKTPGVDTAWDTLHTFVRIPAGVVMAAGAVGDVSQAGVIAAGIVGGTLATTSHVTKAGSRVMINTSPEPFSNWTASFAEDLAVIGGLWAALQHPVLFLIGLFVFLLFLIWLLPRLWRGISSLFSKIAGWFGGGSPTPAQPPWPPTQQQPPHPPQQLPNSHQTPNHHPPMPQTPAPPPPTAQTMPPELTTPTAPKKRGISKRITLPDRDRD